GTVLLRRIRAKVPGLCGGVIEKAAAEALVPHARDPGLAVAIRAYLDGRLSTHLDGIDFEAIVREERDELEKEWQDPPRGLTLAPGEEVLDAVFKHFGFSYAKTKDAPRIAQIMKAEEIDDEIKTVVQTVIGLTNQ